MQHWLSTIEPTISPTLQLKTTNWKVFSAHNVDLSLLIFTHNFIINIVKDTLHFLFVCLLCYTTMQGLINMVSIRYTYND